MIKFYFGNLVDQATITLSSENLLFPKKNMKHPFRTKVSRSQTNADNMVLDFLETSEVDTVILVDNWRDGFGISTISIEMNATSDFTTPPFTQALTFNSIFGVGINEFTLQNYRFANLVMTSTLAFCELSKVFIGKKMELLNEKSINYGWSYLSKNLSIIKTNRYGQKFVDTIGKQREFSVSFSNLTKDQHDQIVSLHDANSTTKPFFVSIGCADMTNTLERYQGMVYLSAEPKITNTSFGRYGMSMTMLEAM